MKKGLAFLVAVLLTLSCTVAMAEWGTHAFNNSSFNGMLTDGSPDGYGILTFENGKIVLGEMQGAQYTGYLASLSGAVLPGSIPEDFSLTLTQYADGKVEGKSYNYFAGGRWNETVYQNGEPVTSTVVQSDGSVAGYEMQAGQWVKIKDYTPAEIEGTIFAAGPMTLFANIDDHHTCIVFFSADTYTMGGGVNIRSDGASYLFFGENGAFCYGDMSNEAYYTGTLENLSPVEGITSHYAGGITRSASAAEEASIDIDDIDDMLLLAETVKPGDVAANDTETDAGDATTLDVFAE